MSHIPHIIVIALVTFFVASCAGDATVNETKFKKDIPARFIDHPERFYALSQQRALQLKVDTLQNGFDSLQIRIWYNYALLSLQNVLILKKANAVWSATFHTINFDWNDNKPTDTVKQTFIKIVNPKNGWDNFLNKLFALQVMSLPDMNDIPGLRDDWADGVSCDVEIAAKTQYRFYSYHMPGKFADKYWQAKNMTGILKLAEEELGVGSPLFTTPLP